MEAHRSPHYWAQGVTKRGIKATIIATMARGCRNIYKAFTSTGTRYRDTPRNTYCCSITLLYFYKELPCIDFDIGDIVVGTTPVTTLRELPYHFYSRRDEGLAPSGRTYLDWRIFPSSRSLTITASRYLPENLRSVAVRWRIKYHWRVLGRYSAGAYHRLKVL